MIGGVVEEAASINHAPDTILSVMCRNSGTSPVCFWFESGVELASSPEPDGCAELPNGKSALKKSFCPVFVPALLGVNKNLYPTIITTTTTMPPRKIRSPRGMFDKNFIRKILEYGARLGYLICRLVCRRDRLHFGGTFRFTAKMV